MRPQPITLDQIRFFKKNRGNALGISNADGPLICTFSVRTPILDDTKIFILLNIAISWSDEFVDERILNVARNMVNRGNATAYEQELGNRFLYQNYTAKKQDVFPSYGKENLERLRAIR